MIRRILLSAALSVALVAVTATFSAPTATASDWGPECDNIADNMDAEFIPCMVYGDCYMFDYYFFIMGPSFGCWDAPLIN